MANCYRFINVYIGLTLALIMTPAMSQAADYCSALNTRGKGAWKLFEDTEYGFQFCYPGDLRYEITKSSKPERHGSQAIEEIKFFDKNNNVEVFDNGEKVDYDPLIISLYATQEDALRGTLFETIEDALEASKEDGINEFGLIELKPCFRNSAHVCSGEPKYDDPNYSRKIYDLLKSEGIRYIFPATMSGGAVQADETVKDGIHIISAKHGYRRHYEEGGNAGEADDGYSAGVLSKDFSLGVWSETEAGEIMTNSIQLIPKK